MKVSFNTRRIPYKWLITVSSGVFMFLSLYVYRVYHIDEVVSLTGHGMLFRALTHALIIALVFFLVESFISPYLQVHDRVKPLITAALATLMGLQLTFLAFNYFYYWTVLSWRSYFQFYYEYPLILIIPLALSYLMDQINRPQSIASEGLISISSDNQKEHFQIKSEHLLFIKSADNYIEIYFRSDQQVRKLLLRKSLKDIEQTYSGSGNLVRCHRSYLINPTNVDLLSKSSSKIELTIAGMTVPVSKKYEELLKEKSPQIFTPHLEISSQTV